MSSRPLFLSCESVTKGYGVRPLFEDVSVGIFEGDRAGLIGPSGSGKTTLLRILAGLDEPDQGTRSLRKGVRLGYVPQDPTFPAESTVEQVLTGALDDLPIEDFEKSSRVSISLGRAGFLDPRGELLGVFVGEDDPVALVVESHQPDEAAHGGAVDGVLVEVQPGLVVGAQERLVAPLVQPVPNSLVGALVAP